jgi:hypothetical protein
MKSFFRRIFGGYRPENYSMTARVGHMNQVWF